VPFSCRLRCPHRPCRAFLAISCAVLLARGGGAALAQAKAPAPQAAAPSQGAAPPSPGTTPEKPPAKIPADQLDSLVAPIALYPDPLLAQTLVASTYPLEIIQLQQWLTKNKNLKDKALTDAVAKQPWDPSVQSMAAVPDVVKRLADDVQWTTDLGNAFLDQQADVMDAVQRMRKKAQETGALKTTEQQKVETKVVEQKTVIIVEPANPQVIYVPVYNPVVVYPPPPYPYPPIYYPPPPPPGAAFVAFGVGMAIGAAYGGSCCGCGWGGNNVTINVNNNYNRNANVNTGGGGNWQHNPQHRGGAPYSNKATATKYGGSARGEPRQASARSGGAVPSNRASGPAGGAGTTNRAGGAPRNAGGGGLSNRSGSSGGDQIGNRGIPSSGGSKGASEFGGGAGGYSGNSARASSSRGASSMGSSGGGSQGGSRGGGSRGGGGGRR